MSGNVSPDTFMSPLKSRRLRVTNLGEPACVKVRDISEARLRQS